MKSIALASSLGFAAFIAANAAWAGTLEDVKARGILKCGSDGQTPGFSVPDDKGYWKGLDADLCRAVAAAVLGDAAKVMFIPLSNKDRFTALQTGSVDMLARTTTWTMSREIALGLQFGPVNYYDGQGFMVRKALNMKTARDLNGASVCVVTGTTTELNAADFFRSNTLRYEPVVFADGNEAAKAYDSGRCDAFTADTSALYSIRPRLIQPDEHMVLPTIISKEPLGPSWR